MPANPLTDVRQSGAQRIISIATAAGPADEVATTITIDADGVFRQLNNNGTPIEKTLGDGSKVMPIQGAEPATLVPGQYFIETIAAVEYLCFIDANGVKQILPATGSSVTVPLTDGVPVAVDIVTHDDSILWLVDIIAPSGAYLTLQVLCATQDANNTNFVLLPGTGPNPHTVEVTRSAGDSTLQITADGVGFTARARRSSMS